MAELSVARTKAPAAAPAEGFKEVAARQLSRVCSSNTFRSASRLRRFLEFIVTETLAGRKEQLKEYVVGVAVFDKPSSFDPRTDPIVRVRARRLRALLQRYYEEEADASELVIELPKGGYAPVLHPRAASENGNRVVVTLASRNVIAVLPFEDFTGETELAGFGQQLRREITCALVQLPGLRVLADQAPAREADPRLSEAAILVGCSVRAAGDGLRLLLYLVDNSSGCYLWSDSVEGPRHDSGKLHREAARRIVAQVQQGVKGRSRLHPSENLTARNLYLQGRYYLGRRTEEGLRKAANYFERALKEDPQFALAHSGLADAYSLLGHYGVLAPAEVWNKAASTAATAFMLDPDAAEIHTTLAHVKACQDWDWAGAEQQFRRAIRLDPGYATAHHWFAMVCLVPLGRLAEAQEEIRIAQSLDPVSAIIARDVALVEFYLGHLDAALELCDSTIELNPHFAPAFWALGCIQAQRKDYEEANAAFCSAIRLAPTLPRMHAALGYLGALTGQRPEWESAIHKLQEMASTHYVSPFDLALIYFALGEAKPGFEHLRRACQDRSFELLWINVDPRFAAARKEPRYREIARTLGTASAPRPARVAARSRRPRPV